MSSCLCVFLSGYVIYGFYGVTMNGFLKIFSFGFIWFFLSFKKMSSFIHLFTYLCHDIYCFIYLFIYLLFDWYCYGVSHNQHKVWIKAFQIFLRNLLWAKTFSQE